MLFRFLQSLAVVSIKPWPNPITYTTSVGLKCPSLGYVMTRKRVCVAFQQIFPTSVTNNPTSRRRRVACRRRPALCDVSLVLLESSTRMLIDYQMTLITVFGPKLAHTKIPTCYPGRHSLLRIAVAHESGKIVSRDFRKNPPCGTRRDAGLNRYIYTRIRRRMLLRVLRKTWVYCFIV